MPAQESRQCTPSQVGPPAGTPSSTMPGSPIQPELNGLDCMGDTIATSSDNSLGTTSIGSSVSVISGNGSSGPTVRYIAYDRVATGPDGQPCITTGYYPAGTQPNDSAALDPVTQNVNDIHGIPPLEYPPCPARPQQAGEPPAVETPSMIARRYWEQVPLPTPRPSIAPGRAITGKLAYLETSGEIYHTYSNDTAVGQLQIHASGSYVVDWGDGETSGPYRFEGAPWPNGTITHDYQNVGSYDVVVTEKWTASWSLGGETGVLRTLQTSGRINDFPVEQIQAVIGR